MKTGVGFAVVAATLALAALSLGACGDDEDGQEPDPAPTTTAAETTDEKPTAKQPQVCADGTIPLGFADGVVTDGVVRVVYAGSGSLEPCSLDVSESDDGSLEVELRVPDLQIQTLDLAQWCAETPTSAVDGTKK